MLQEALALDFIPPENTFTTEIEKETNLRLHYISSVVKKWLAVMFLGLFVGLLGAIESIIVEEMLIFKFSVLSKSLRNSLIGSSFLWMFWTIFPITLCAFLVVRVEPTLKGSGVASVIAYMNGVRIKRFHKALTLWLQYFTIFFISGANMPGGKEELFINVGALSGAHITKFTVPYFNWKPFLSITDPISRRALVAAGTAAGVSVSFGTPIGAVLFCLEEGLTFWSPDLTFLMFLCTICSIFVLHFSYTFYSSYAEIDLDILYYLFFSGVENIDLTYKFLEIPMFFIMGAIGGILGSIWNEGHIFLYSVRKKFIKTNTQKILEVICLGAVLSLCGIVTFHSFGAECTHRFEKGSRISRSKEMKTYCKEEKLFESVGIFLFQDLRHIISSLFLANKEPLSTSVLIFGAVFFFIFSGLQLGSHLPSGILVPHLICGASWGYLFGVWYNESIEENLIVTKYAFLGAVAQGSGAARLTLSLGIIMIESCGKHTFAIPIFIIVVTAKWFGGIFSRPIYRIESYLEGYPFLRATYLPLSSPYKAKHIMASSMVTASRYMTCLQLIAILKTNHQSFPVLEDGKVIGVISKYQLAILLKTKTYDSPDSLQELEIMNKRFQEYLCESFIEMEEVLHLDYKVDASNVNLTDFMDPSPHLINLEMSLRRIYLMFVALGCSCTIVVDNSLNPVGIITRKDIAAFRKLSQFLRMETEIIPLKYH